MTRASADGGRAFPRASKIAVELVFSFAGLGRSVIPAARVMSQTCHIGRCRRVHRRDLPGARQKVLWWPVSAFCFLWRSARRRRRQGRVGSWQNKHWQSRVDSGSNLVDECAVGLCRHHHVEAKVAGPFLAEAIDLARRSGRVVRRRQADQK